MITGICFGEMSFVVSRVVALCTIPKSCAFSHLCACCPLVLRHSENPLFSSPQVESLSPGHYFDSRREGSTLRQPRKVATEVTRKLPRIMPNPPHPDSAVFAVVEEDALNFSRFVISGPVDTPYENGLFVFDVFLPANYPTDPPLVQMITTGQGTVK